MPDEFWQWFNEQLKTNGWSDSDLSREAGINHSVVSKARGNFQSIGYDALKSIARAFHVHPAEVFAHAGLIPPMPTWSPEIEELFGLLTRIKSYHVTKKCCISWGMKHLLVALALLFSVSITPITNAHAAPSEQLSVLQTAEAVLTAKLATYRAWQESYRATHGHYYQSLITHSTIPADGVTVSPDLLNNGPTDQVEKASVVWSSVSFPAKTAFALTIDVYDGPQGAGHVATLTIKVSGVTYVRAVNTGPETWREKAWSVAP